MAKYIINYMGNDIDVSRAVITNSFNFQSRIDEVFASGAAKIRTAKITKNIPPYSLMTHIDNEGKETQYLCSSSSNRYLTKNKWTHDITLLEPTAILECFVIGSKNFSATGTNRKDYEKLFNILVDLVYQKYGYTLYYDEVYKNFDQEHEYPFGPGSTVFQILTEIATRYNYRPKVSKIEGNNVYVSFVNLADNALYPLDLNKILAQEYNQNVNDYCKYLEGEMTNVIDRDTEIIIDNITPRADDILLNADSAKLFLPTKAEKITEFKVHKKGNIYTVITFAENEYQNILNSVAAAGLEWSRDVVIGNQIRYITKTLQEWIDLRVLKVTVALYSYVSNADNEIYNLPEYVWNNYLSPYYTDDFKRQLWTLRGVFEVENGVDVYSSFGFYINDNENYTQLSNVDTTYPLTHRLLESSQWNSLTAAEQPKYAVYDTGSNNIYNLNSEYRKDLWNQLIGTDVGNVLAEIDDVVVDKTFINIERLYIRISVQEVDNNPSKYSYYVKYKAITDPLMIDTKDDLPENELRYKPFTRTYDKSSNFIDYDLLTESMRKSNDMLGRIEASITYDIGGIEPPVAGQSIEYEGMTFIIASIVYTHTLKRDLAVLNLTKSYNKVADAIGVKTQFNATKNPLNNIIDRPIHYDMNNLRPYQFNFDNVYFKMSFSSGQTLFKKAVYSTTGEVVRFYCEAINQYTFDRKVIGTGNNKEVRDIPYVDQYNECKYVDIQLVSISNMTYSESLSLPEFTGTYTTLDFGAYGNTWRVILHKDARERLTFTFKMKGVKIEP